nr:substrate-binding domain-containing protein [Bacillus taeanensis]
MLPDTEEIYLMKIMKSIERVTSMMGYKIIFCFNHYDSKREVPTLQWLIEKRVDGIIMYPTGNNLDDVEIPTSIPVVLIERKIEGANFDIVMHENKDTATQLVQHLYDKGHRKLFFIHGSSANSIEEERLNGIKLAITSLGLDRSKQTLLELNNRWDINKITEKIAGFLQVKKPEGIFATNPNFLAGAVRAAWQLGLQISEDIDIIGFGEVDPFDIFRPKVTIAKENPDKIGQVAVDVLFSKIKKQFQNEPRKYIIQPEIIIGNSSNKLTI